MQKDVGTYCVIVGIKIQIKVQTNRWRERGQTNKNCWQ